MSSSSTYPKSPLGKRYSSPQYSDLRDKLSRRRSGSWSKSRSPDTRFKKSSSSHSRRNYRMRSRSPVRSHSRHVTSKSSRRTPSPPRRSTRSPEFRTPHSPRRRSPGRSSSKYPKETSSSQRSREKSHRSSKSKSRIGDKREDQCLHMDSSPEDVGYSRRIIESSKVVNSSTVLAGVDVEPSVSKMLKKIVAKTDKKKKGRKNEKLELVLRKPKKKKHKKNKLEAPIIKTEPGTDESVPPDLEASNVIVKTEPGMESSAELNSSPLTSPLAYFKPRIEVELQPILGHSKCRICKSYYPDTDDRRNHHLAQHPDRVFLVNLPVDTFYYDIEEAISHMAKFGINRTDLQQKVRDCNLIKLPTNLKGFSCNLCKLLDTNSEKEFMSHVKEECNVTNKEDRAQHMVCFCRGCHSKFTNKVELSKHLMKGSCWPSMMIINRLYDQSGAEVPAKKDNAAAEKEKMIKVKQEKLERVQQMQLKREMFEEREQTQAFPQVERQQSPFNAYALPSTHETMQQPEGVIPSNSDLQNILQNIQNNQGMNIQVPSQMNQMDISKLQGIQQLSVNNALNPQAKNFVPPVDFSIPPPSLPFNLPTSLLRPNMAIPPQPSPNNIYKVERSNSPTLSVRSDLSIKSVPIEEPSPSFSPLRQHSRSRSRIRSQGSVESHRHRCVKPSNPAVAPPAPSLPLPTLGDLFNPAGPSNGKRSPSVESIISSGSNSRIASSYNCRWSRCLWTDTHSSTCAKPEIIGRCARDECDWYSLHRDYPLCDKLSFYCNCKKLKTGLYKYYDDMPQVIRISTAVDGQRDTTVMEPKNVPMRLLYRSVSRVVSDPRVSQRSYPTSHPKPSRVLRGKKGRQKGWTEKDVICTWQAVTMVKVIPEDNPYIVNDDRDSDVEELSPEDCLPKLKKLSSTKRRSSSQDREIW